MPEARSLFLAAVWAQDTVELLGGVAPAVTKTLFDQA